MIADKNECFNLNFPGSIVDIEYCLPKRVLTNDDLEQQFPNWNVKATEKKMGVKERRISSCEETALDLAMTACTALLDKHKDLHSKIDAIIFCTQTPDYILPSNAFLVHNRLNFSNKVLAFDYNLACSGYVYGLLMASSLIKSGLVDNVLLITGDTYSKIIDDEDRSTRMLFGDGAAATWIGRITDQNIQPLINKICTFELGTNGAGWNKFLLQSGAHRHPNKVNNCVPASDKINMNGMQVLNFVKNTVVPHIQNFLKKVELDSNQVDQFLIHQASKLALDTIQKKIEIHDEQLYTNINLIGNTVSSSIPILIKDYFVQNTVPEKSKLVISGFGVGYSWGSVLVER